MNIENIKCIPNPKIKFHKVCGEFVLLLPQETHFYALNDSGSWVWEQILQGKIPTQIAKNLAKRYGISEDEARKDIIALLTDLDEKDALKKQPL
ncbi:MAG: PqqD family protein [Deltaproteobacteria bacterium]